MSRWPGGAAGVLRALLATGAVTVTVAAAGCTTTGRVTGAGRSSARAVRADSQAGQRTRGDGVLGPPGGSPALARKTGLAMLTRLAFPPGARPTSTRGLRAADQIGSPDLVEVTRFYWVPLSEHAADGFFGSHLPAGMAPAGSGSGAAPGSASYFQSVTYTLRKAPAGIDGQSELLVTLRADPGGGTVVRADAEVVWYPWRTAAEYLRPADFRSVTVSGSFGSLTNSGTTVRRSRTFTSRAVIARLAAVLDGLRADNPGTVHCPMLLASYRLSFAPAGGGAPTVVTPSSCLGDGVTVAGRPQPALFDPNNQKVLAVVGRLLGVPRSDW